jgi:hypothetical protein
MTDVQFMVLVTLACSVVARYGRRVPYLAIGFLVAGGLGVDAYM